MPWPLKRAETLAWRASMIGALGLPEPDDAAEAHLLCADALRVQAWASRRVK